MKYTVKSSDASITVNQLGAELCSMKMKEKEYIWQADPSYWGDHGPLLFPIVGRIHEGKISIGGVDCHMDTHGFLSHMEFELDNITDNSITLSVQYNEETMRQYPYKFKVVANYTIDKKTLVGKYSITNLDTKTMPYGFGLHNGFNCLEKNGEDVSDVFLDFEKPISVEKPGRTEDNFMIFSEPIKVMENESRLYLNDDWYPVYAPVMENINFHSFKLGHKKTGQILSYEFSKNFDLFNAWRAPGSSFICLEPWSSQCGIYPYAKTLEEVSNTKYLESGATEVYEFSVTL